MEASIDKGWSWVVLCGVFFTTAITFGFMQCLGVFYIDWQEDFGASAQAVGWSSSIFIAGFGISGLMSSFLSTYMSCRLQGLIGGVITTASLSCSYLVNSLSHLYIIMAISGFGSGLSFANAIIILAFYFKKKLAIASGLGLCGGPLGIFALAPFIRYLNDEYSWRGAMMICGALLANISALAALFRKTKVEHANMKILRPAKPDHYHEISLKTTANKKESVTENGCNGYSNLPTQSQPKRKISVVQHVRRHSTAFVKPYAEAMSIRFLTMSTLNGLLTGFSYTSALMYFVSNAINLGVSKTDAAFLLSIFGLCSCVARLMLTPIVDRNVLKPAQLGSLVMAVGGVTCFLGSLARTYTTLVVFAIALAFSAPTHNIILPLILKDVVGISHYKKMFGILSIAFNGGSLVGLPIIGHVYDIRGDYAVSFYIAGGAMVCNSIINLMDPIWVSLDHRLGIQHGTHEDNTEKSEV